MPVEATILARLKPPAPDDETLRNWGARLQRDLGLEEDDFYSDSAPLSHVSEDDWDEMPIVDEPSVWLKLNLHANYYGPGYERGSIELYIQLAEWLEANLPNCEVYYGTDCGEAAQLFDSTMRAKFLNYFRQVGWEPYHNLDKQRAEELRTLWESS